MVTTKPSQIYRQQSLRNCSTVYSWLIQNHQWDAAKSSHYQGNIQKSPSTSTFLWLTLPLSPSSTPPPLPSTPPVYITITINNSHISTSWLTKHHHHSYQHHQLPLPTTPLLQHHHTHHHHQSNITITTITNTIIPLFRAWYTCLGVQRWPPTTWPPYSTSSTPRLLTHS